MKLKLKKNIIIPADTIMDSEKVASETRRNRAAFVSHNIDFGPNSTGQLLIGHEVGDSDFDEWFERVPD